MGKPGPEREDWERKVEGEEEKRIKGSKRTFSGALIHPTDFLLWWKVSPEPLNGKVKAMFQTRLCCIQSCIQRCAAVRPLILSPEKRWHCGEANDNDILSMSWCNFSQRDGTHASQPGRQVCSQKILDRAFFFKLPSYLQRLALVLHPIMTSHAEVLLLQFFPFHTFNIRWADFWNWNQEHFLFSFPCSTWLQGSFFFASGGFFCHKKLGLSLENTDELNHVPLHLFSAIRLDAVAL